MSRVLILSSSLRVATRRHALQPPVRSLCGNNARHRRSSLALRVHRSAVATPAAPINERQRVQQTWTLLAEDRASSGAAIEKLKIQTPGVTVVSWRPELRQTRDDDAVVAEIRVSSDARTLLDSVDVRSKAPFRAIVGFRAPRGGSDVARGHLLTEIHVADARQLRSVAAAAGADVVIHDDVLCTASPRSDDEVHASVPHKLKLAAVGRSRLSVDCRATPLNVRRLDVAVAGGGAVALALPSLTVSNAVCMAVAGAGEIDAIVDGAVDVGDVDLAVVGDGRVRLHVHEPALRAADVRTKVAGAGEICVTTGLASSTEASSTSPFCASQSIHIAGDGRVDLGDVPTTRASVHVVGDGRCVVRPQQRLAVANVGAATVDCIERVPQDVELRGAPAASVRAVDAVERGVHTVDPPPTVETAFADGYVLRLPPQSLWTRLAQAFSSSR
ncbi:hypothetical protein PINS_up022907 [Pythium insidiosum]|nr:hypothetical protein PINS_up022907 [Pythium insidiosum]